MCTCAVGPHASTFDTCPSLIRFPTARPSPHDFRHTCHRSSVHVHTPISHAPTRSPPLKPPQTTSNPLHRDRRRAAMHEPVDVAKTHEILARFRPIAPKPQLPAAQVVAPALHLRPRPCRACKRGRTAPANRQRAALGTAALQPPSGNPFSPSRLQSPRAAQPLVERDLLRSLQAPKIIAPRPVRPVGSSISVGLISEGTNGSPPPPAPKTPDEVEDEVESEALPAVVSDHNNRVRMANSAYKELVGQPECMWLDETVPASSRWGFGLRPPSRRINGEVMLDFSGGSARPPASSEGFSCRAKIEWACNGTKTFVDAPCDVIRVHCKSGDYHFAWRFHVPEAC